MAFGPDPRLPLTSVSCWGRLLAFVSLEALQREVAFEAAEGHAERRYCRAKLAEASQALEDVRALREHLEAK